MAHRALGGEYVLVHNGIDVARFAKATPWPTGGPTLFFVGRHEPRKGLSVLLELSFLHGRAKLTDLPVTALLTV